MQKTYKCGFYGGKFLPFHAGHKYCIKVAASECDRLVVIFFSNSEEEAEIISRQDTVCPELLNKQARIEAIKRECDKYTNVEFAILDCAVMHRQAIIDGTDLWDSETQYVMDTVGEFQAVYTSEPGYDAYFKRAYPFAVHRLIDPPRIHVPISGTKIRTMDIGEAKKWL